ncbi:MAG: hypothetical protein QNJ04_09920 [Desulfobacterales bacterium]|nr:hypothetical protein [Desulfobacterales bacterium]
MGANKDIGFEVTLLLFKKVIHVLAGARDAGKDEESVKALQDEGVSAE